MAERSDGVREVKLRIGRASYVLMTDAESEESVRAHAALLDHHAQLLLKELDAVPEKLVLLLAAIQALDDVDSDAAMQEEDLLEAADTTEDVSRRIRDLTARIA